jgi:hypothetical protein
MSEDENDKELSPEQREELQELRGKFHSIFQADPKAQEMAKDFVEMNAAAYEAERMSEGESFARGFLNMLIGTFGKGERARRAKNRGSGLLTNFMFNRAMEKEDGKPEEKLEVTEEEMVKAFNGEMEGLKAPVVARKDGENIEISTWDTGDEEDS